MGDAPGHYGADLRHGDLEVREDLQEIGFEFGIRAVDLVDQQHRGLFLADGAEQGPLQQILFGKDLLFQGFHIGRAACCAWGL